jgi:hypothetical protein
MIATAMRAARESGIALCITCLIVRNSSIAIYDAEHSEKVSPSAQHSSGAILPIDGNDNDAGSCEGILAAVAIEGFQELGLALEKARKRVKRRNAVESVAAAYLEFAASSPALYEVMFLLSLSVPFGEAATPPELRFAFSQLLELFQGQSSKAEVLSELFWASLHGIAELSRTKRFPPSRQKERVRTLVELFSFPKR